MYIWSWAGVTITFILKYPTLKLACLNSKLAQTYYWRIKISDPVLRSFQLFIPRVFTNDRRSIGAHLVAITCAGTRLKQARNQYERFLVLRYPGYPVHWFLILDVFLELSFVCVFCGLQVFLFCEYCNTFCWMTWQPYWKERYGIQTQYPRGKTTPGYGSHSYWSKLRWGGFTLFLTLIFILLSPVSKQPSSHFIQTNSNYFVGIEDIIMKTCIYNTCDMYTFIE